MIPCSEPEGERREADAEAKAERFEAAHDKAWSEMQAATPASAIEIFGKLATLEGGKAHGLMAGALKKLTAYPAWDLGADRAAAELMRMLLRLVADQKASQEIKND